MKKIVFLVLVLSFVCSSSFAEQKKGFFKGIFSRESAEEQSTKANDNDKEPLYIINSSVLNNIPIVAPTKLQLVMRDFSSQQVETCEPSCDDPLNKACILEGRLFDYAKGFQSFYGPTTSPEPSSWHNDWEYNSSLDLRCVFRLRMPKCTVDQPNEISDSYIYAASELVCNQLASYSSSIKSFSVSFYGGSFPGDLSIQPLFHNGELGGYRVRWIDPQ